MNKIVVWVNLRDNSEVFNSEFFVLSTVQSGKLGAGKPRNFINVPLRKLQGFHSEFSGFGYGANWKTGSWKTSEFDQCTSEKTLRFSTPRFEYSAKWKTPSRPRCFDK